MKNFARLAFGFKRNLTYFFFDAPRHLPLKFQAENGLLAAECVFFPS